MLSTTDLERIKSRLERCKCQAPHTYEINLISKILEEVEKAPETAVQIGIVKVPPMVQF